MNAANFCSVVRNHKIGVYQKSHVLLVGLGKSKSYYPVSSEQRIA
ncbi:hypothetical protein [Mastigocoleus testarum]|nr:hypothetical protein [Mastigocoleus testarum]